MLYEFSEEINEIFFSGGKEEVVIGVVFGTSGCTDASNHNELFREESQTNNDLLNHQDNKFNLSPL